MAGRGATLSLACASANICGLLAFPCESLRFSAPPLCCAVRSRWPEPNRAEFSTLRWILLRSIRPSEIPRRRGELLELLEKERRDTRVKRQITRTIFLFWNIYPDLFLITNGKWTSNSFLSLSLGEGGMDDEEFVSVTWNNYFRERTILFPLDCECRFLIRSLVQNKFRV